MYCAPPWRVCSEALDVRAARASCCNQITQEMVQFSGKRCGILIVAKQLPLPRHALRFVVPLLTEPQKDVRKKHSQGDDQAHKRSVFDLEVELQLQLHPTLQRPGASTPGWLVALGTRPAYLRKCCFPPRQPTSHGNAFRFRGLNCLPPCIEYTSKLPR